MPHYNDGRLRDILTAHQHVAATARTYEMAGRLLLGLEPLRWLFNSQRRAIVATQLETSRAYCRVTMRETKPPPSRQKRVIPT
jgi:hypothetical protein